MTDQFINEDMHWNSPNDEKRTFKFEIDVTTNPDSMSESELEALHSAIKWILLENLKPGNAYAGYDKSGKLIQWHVPTGVQVRG